MPKRLQTYETEAITVTFDPNICQHSGVCVRGLHSVFDLNRPRWIRPEAASPDEVRALITDADRDLPRPLPQAAP